jgi:hypothetical protein
MTISDKEFEDISIGMAKEARKLKAEQDAGAILDTIYIPDVDDRDFIREALVNAYHLNEVAEVVDANQREAIEVFKAQIAAADDIIDSLKITMRILKPYLPIALQEELKDI